MKYTEDMKFVERFQHSIAEFAILNKALQTSNVTPENVVSSLPKTTVSIPRSVVDKCFETLVEDGHLQKQGNQYTITDDGREDIQKLQPLALEIPQLVQNVGGQPPRQGVQQPAGGYGGSAQQQPTRPGSTGTQQPGRR
jgi:predicted transcriptional regulator